MLNNALKEYLELFFDASKLNRLPKQVGGEKIFSSPLIGVAKGDDPIFLKFKEVVGPEHYTPHEMWNLNMKKRVLANQLRVLSIIFPFSQKIREEGLKPIKLKRILIPSEYYSIARNYANEFIAISMEKVIKFIEKKGFNGVAGVLSAHFTVFTKKKLYSNWSERHIAFAAGLGTFSLHEGLITEVGCNVRLGSIITDCPLEVTPRNNDDPYSNCLFFSNGTCKECIDKCPINAITENGHDKVLCNKYRLMVSRKMVPRLQPYLKPHFRRINNEWTEESYPVGCAFCQFGVCCMDKNPTAK
jgi:epoxyqueuosine reductase